MKRCSHAETLSFKVCKNTATYRVKRAANGPKTPWRYMCEEHLRLLAERNGRRDRIVVETVSE